MIKCLKSQAKGATAIDKFGPDVKVVRIAEGNFDIAVEVSISPTFFAWVFQFAKEMKIMDPPDVQEDYVKLLELALDNGLDDGVDDWQV